MAAASLIWQRWERTAARWPRQPAVIEADTGARVTCGELRDLAGARAAGWPATGRGRPLAFSLPNGIEWWITFLALQRLGAIAVPLDPALTGDALATAARRLKIPTLATAKSGRAATRPAGVWKVTSGTTGGMQVVRCAARQLIADGEQVMRTMGIRRSDRNLAIIPLGHSYGLGNLVMPLVLAGTPVVCVQGVAPHHLLEVIGRHQVTVLPAVPVVLRALALTRGVGKPAALRLVISAGAILPAETARAFHARFGLKLHNFYGASETGGICYDRTGQATLTGRSVGQPLAGVRVTLGKRGRVMVRSAAVAAPRGVVVLPDRGEWVGRGELRLIGRVGVVANIGGKKVAPAEVEAALRRLRGVTDAWVTALTDARGNGYLAAAVESALPAAELETALARELPPWKLPKRYHVRPRLPRTARGKLDTAALRALVAG